jgi:serine/threonine protein kinase
MINTDTALNNYEIRGLLGQGKFGKVFKGFHIDSGEIVAIKQEPSDGLLMHEASVLKYLYENGCKKVPLVYWFGLDIINECATLVMPIFEISLHDYALNNSLGQETILRIVLDMVNIIEDIHSFNIIHRDIKPQNFMMKGQDIYLIDFGLSTIKASELDDNKKTKIIGTPKYISFRIHEGFVPSVIDDVISIGYIFLWLITGYLPWENIKSTSIDVDGYSENHILHYKNKMRSYYKSWPYLGTHLRSLEQPILYKVLKHLYECEQLDYMIIKGFF